MGNLGCVNRQFEFLADFGYLLSLERPILLFPVSKQRLDSSINTANLDMTAHLTALVNNFVYVNLVILG